jgi:hypothetical protein
MCGQKYYGRMKPIRGVETLDKRAEQMRKNRKPETAIKDKLNVLRDFGIVDDNNEESMGNEMRQIIKDSSDADFDRVLDGFARKLISKKFGG